MLDVFVCAVCPCGNPRIKVSVSGYPPWHYVCVCLERHRWSQWRD